MFELVVENALMRPHPIWKWSPDLCREVMMIKEQSIFYRAGLGNFLLFGLPILIAIALTVVLGLSRFADDSPAFYAGVALMGVGWCLLIRSKWDQVRRADFFSWGISDAKMRRLYVISYLIMAMGYLLSTFSSQF